MVQRRVILLVLAFIIFATTGLSAAAQTPAASEVSNEDELAGLQAAVWRTYAREGTFADEGVMNGDDATPVSSAAGMSPLRSISVVVRELDTVENAELACAQVSSTAEISLAGAFPADGTQEISIEALPGIGSQATLIRSDYAEPDWELWVEYVVVQRDQYVFLVLVDGSTFPNLPGSEDVDKSLPTEEIATAIAAEGEPSPEEPEFMEDGTSTGGLWGFMPPGGDPALMGLVPVQDSIIYPYPVPSS